MTTVKWEAGSPVTRTDPFTRGLSGNGTAANFASDDPAYIVDVNENGEAYLFKEVVGVTGALANGKLTATVYAPDGGPLIAAVYDANGALVSVKVITVEASAEVRHIDAGLTVGKDETCTLMLVNASTYAPLCAAWNN